VKSQVASAAQVCVHPPPEHVNEQLPPAPQAWLQPPPEQVASQSSFAAHDCMHEPFGQSPPPPPSTLGGAGGVPGGVAGGVPGGLAGGVPGGLDVVDDDDGEGVPVVFELQAKTRQGTTKTNRTKRIGDAPCPSSSATCVPRANVRSERRACVAGVAIDVARAPCPRRR
jgi:hypothetical protein